MFEAITSLIYYHPIVNFIHPRAKGHSVFPKDACYTVVFSILSWGGILLSNRRSVFGPFGKLLKQISLLLRVSSGLSCGCSLHTSSTTTSHWCSLKCIRTTGGIIKTKTSDGFLEGFIVVDGQSH